MSDIVHLIKICNKHVIYLYLYLYVCVCVCVEEDNQCTISKLITCVEEKEKEVEGD